MITAFLLLTGVLTATSALLLVQSVRRRDDLRALAGMTVLLGAALPATVYGSLIS